MRHLLYIGMGGFCGAVLRYLLSGGVQKWAGSAHFPYGTLVVNLTGCLVIGMLTRMDEMRAILSPEMRYFIFVGILGAFTTYSTFSNEAVNLINDRRVVPAMLYVGGTCRAGPGRGTSRSPVNLYGVEVSHEYSPGGPAAAPFHR
jgi:CrcB protein